MIRRQPIGPVTCTMAANTASMEGDAKVSPETAAVNRPAVLRSCDPKVRQA